MDDKFIEEIRQEALRLCDLRKDVGLQIEENNLIFKGRAYSLEAVKWVDFKQTRVNQSLNYMKTGVADIVDMKITLDSGEKLRISYDERGVFLGFNKDYIGEINTLKELWPLLLKKTYDIRLKKYMDEFGRDGFFTYGNWNLCPPSQFRFKDKVYSIKDYLIIRQPHQFLLRKKKNGFLGTIGLIARGDPVIQTSTDTDIIEYILRTRFKIMI